jgi:hypothetical protein
MSLKLNTASGGSITLQEADTASNLTLTVPAQAGSIVTADSSGNVGVGTSSPQRKVSIVGVDGSTGLTEGNSRTSLFLDNAGANYLSIYTNTTGNGGIFFSDNGSNNGGIVYETSTDALYFRANNTERMRIDSSGRVTMPYQPCFHAYRSAGNVSATSIVVFNSVVTNNGGHYNASNGRFTAPVAGYYRFTASLLRVAGSILQYRMFKNSTMVAETEDSNTANYAQVAQAAIVQLGVGDYFEIQVRGGVAYGASSYSTFQGELIG